MSDTASANGLELNVLDPTADKYGEGSYALAPRLTSLEGKTRDQVRAEVDKYMTANPQTKAELTGIRQPLVDIKNRCGDTNGDGVADE